MYISKEGRVFMTTQVKAVKVFLITATASHSFYVN